MKRIIWGGFAFLAAIWTGVVALSAAVVRAAVSLLQASGGSAVSETVGQIPVPDWLAPWADLLGWNEWAHGVAALLESLRGVLPLLGQGLEWLVPLAWVVWGVGLAGLLVLAIIGSRLSTRILR